MAHCDIIVLAILIYVTRFISAVYFWDQIGNVLGEPIFFTVGYRKKYILAGYLLSRACMHSRFMALEEYCILVTIKTEKSRLLNESGD